MMIELKLMQNGNQNIITAEANKETALPRINCADKTFLGYNKYEKLEWGFMNYMSPEDDTLYAIFTDGPAYVIESYFLGEVDNYTGPRCQFRRYVVDVYLENSSADEGILKIDNCKGAFYYLGNIPQDGVKVEVVSDLDIHGGAYINAAYYCSSEILIKWKAESKENSSTRRKIVRIMLAFSRWGMGYSEIERRTSDDIIAPSHGFEALAGDTKALVSANFYNGVRDYDNIPKVRDDDNVVVAEGDTELPCFQKGELLTRFAALSDTHIGLRYDWGNYEWFYGACRKLSEIHKKTPFDFVLQLGDNIDDGYEGSYKTDYDIYLDEIKHLEICDALNPLNPATGLIPHYEMQGNHDTCDETRFFKNKLWYTESVTGKKVAFITFFTTYGGYPAVNFNIAGNYESYRSYGIIDDETISFIEKSILEANKKNVSQIILCSHFGIAQDLVAPILPEAGLGKLDAICKKYGIKLYLSGHEHSVDYSLHKYNKLYNYNASMTKNRYAVYELYENCLITYIYDTDSSNLVRKDLIILEGE